MEKRAWARAYAPYASVVVLLAACVVAWRLLPGRVDDEGSPPAPSAAVDRPQVLRVGVPTSCYSGLLASARRRALLEDAGPPFELLTFQNGRRAFRAMLAGEVGLAVVGDLPVAATYLERQDFAVLAVVAHSSFDTWVVVRDGLKTPADLKGKRIATQKRTGSHYVLEAYLERAGVPVAEVEVVDMPPEEMTKALAAGRVDAFAVESPFPGSVQEHFGTTLEVLHDPGAYRLALLLVVRRDVLERSASEIERLLRMLVAARQDWAADYDAGVANLSDTLVLDPTSAEVQCRQASFDLSLDASTLEAIRREATWFSAHGKDYGKSLPDFGALFAPAPLRAVSPGAVRLAP